MQTSNHILAKEGILTAFAVAKRVTSFDIKKLKEKLKESKVNPEKLQDILIKTIMEQTKSAFESETIPGLMMKEVIKEEEEKKRIMELTYFASVIAKKISDNNTDKYHSCYIINAIVNMLSLTEEDFDEFHRRFARFKEGKSEEDPPVE